MTADRWWVFLLGMWAGCATLIAWRQAQRIARLEVEQEAVRGAVLRLRRALTRPHAQIADALMAELEGLEAMRQAQEQAWPEA